MADEGWRESGQILDLVHESIFARSPAGRIGFWNAAAEQLYGWSRTDAVGRDADELLGSIYPAHAAERDVELFETGHWQGDIERRSRSGRRIVVNATWAVRRDDAGTPIEVIETARDLTQQRESEEAARLLEYRFRNLFQAMAVAFWEVDFNGVGGLLIPLREQGVTDLRAHLSARPELVREAMRLARVLDVNDKTLALFGAVSREQMVGHDVERYWPDDSMPIFTEALAATMAKEPHLITETRLRTLAGDEIDVLFTVSWSPESRKRGVILLGIIDISEQKGAERALRESELRYRSIFNQMPFSFWQLETGDMRKVYDALRAKGVTSLADYAAENPEFVSRALDLIRVSDVNDETVRMMGASSRDQLIGPMARVWTDMEEHVRAADARFKGAQSYSNVSKLQTVDGRTIDVLWTAVFADALSNTGVNLIGAIDVTERVRSVEALARSELKYRDLFQHMPVAMSQLDVTGLVEVLGRLRREGVADLEAYMAAHPAFIGEMLRIMQVMQVNQHTVRLFGGGDPADFVGPIARFWSGSEETVRRSLVARYHGAEAYSEETRVQTLDGRSLDVFFTSAFPPALSQIGIGLVGMIDIGDRLEAERLVQQMQADFAHAARVATLGELTASIAHEVNQPLAAIATNGEASLRWLARETPDVEEVRTLATRMVADARRAADIIAQIRSMASRRAPAHALHSLDELIGEALQFLRREFQAHDVRVSFEPGATPALVRADRTQIQQVIVNLAMNALQAMVQHGGADCRLAFRVAQNDDVVLEVEDNGPGLPPELRARLFDSFVTTKPDGLGIGLAICRSIVEAHGGSISAEDRAPGALFRVVLPLGVPDHTKV